MLPSTLLLAIAAHTVTSVHGTPIETSDSWGHPKAPEHRTVMRSVVMPRAVMKESAISSAEGDLQPKGLGKSRFGLHPMQDKFELCKQSFKSPKQSNHGMQELQASTWKHTSGCSKHELVLWEESNGVRRSSCCPSDAPWCSGCAKSNSQMTACEVCMGGYTSMNGVCVVCADTPGWVNEENQSCQQLQQLPAPQCTNKKYRGLSSKDACCHCGGGHQQASAFSYKVTPLVLGSTLVEGWPVPRTASQYLVDSSCELAQFGLTIGSATGKLSLAPGCASVGCWNNKEPFQVTCTLTARQSAALNASARLLVNARYFGYNDDIIFITTPSSRFQLNSATNLTSPFTKVCLPQGIDSWLKIDTTDGTLTTSFSATEDLPEIMVGNFQGGVTGGVCRVAAAMAGGINEVVQNRTIALVVLAPRPWTGMKFGVTRVFATVGEISPVVTPTRNGGGQIPPRRFSVDCARPGFLFDVVTGAAMVDGHRAFTLDVTTGSLRVAPSKHLLSSLETETADQNRSNAILSCKVYGHYEWRPLTEDQMTIQANLEIDIREDSCWTTVTASFAAENSSNVSKAACRSSCRNSKTCTHFAWQSGICKILSARCRTEDDRCINANSPITAQEKIPNCGERKSCISIAVAGHWFLDGHYCPVGDNGDAGPIYFKTGITAQDSYYLAEYDGNRDTDMGHCSAGHAVLKKAAPPHDFDDAKSNYMELHGGTVACLKGEAVLDKAFTTNRQTVKVSVKNVATDVDGTVQVAGLSCTTPNTTFTKDGDTEDEEQEKLEVQPLVLDDPTTTEPDDHWLHPCQCFPMSWGPKPPVEEASLGEVPPQSGNRFVPAKVDLVQGEFVCEAGSLVGFHTDLEQEALDISDCELLCRSKKFCNFFWRGTVLSTVQCRLYRQCADLVREPGAVGSLMALGDATKTLCRIANPEVCWKVSKRREFLGAQVISNPPFGRCEFEDIVQQCDHKLLIGGIGVEKCARCEFAEADTLPEFAWSHKRPLYKRYEHGQQVKASCWMERFSTFPAANAGLMTCVSGTWLDPAGSFGLSSFTCEACIQVVDAKYADLDMQGVQELFFVDRQEVVLFIDGGNRKFLDNDILDNNIKETWFYLDHEAGVPVRCGRPNKLLCASRDDANCMWGQFPKGMNYDQVPGVVSPRPYEVACPGWRPRDGSDACKYLGCYKDVPPSPQPTPAPTKTGEVTTHIIGCHASSEQDEQWSCSNAYDGNSTNGFATKYESVGGWITLELDSEYVITEFEWAPRISGEGTTRLVIAGSKLGLETVDTSSHQTAKHVLSSMVIGHQIKFQAAGANLKSEPTRWGVEEIKLVGYEYGFPSQILLVNRWRVYGESFQWPTYTVKDGICVVSGLVRGGAWDQVATLPPDCRPQGRLTFNSVNTGTSESNAKSLRLDVLPSGRVLWVAGERYDWISLTGIVLTTATFAARKPLQLIERWLAYEDGYSPPTCAVGVGVVVLEGLITKGPQHFVRGLQKVAHLPKECTPDQDYHFLTNGLDGTNQIFIRDGGVWLQGATATPQTYRISLSGISFKVGSAGSQKLTLKNGWMADRIPTLSLSGGFCFLDGWLKEGGPGGLIGHLPWSCRPENRLIFNVRERDAVAARVDVLPDGSIRRIDNSTGSLTLDGIMFALPLRFVAKTMPSMSDVSKQFRLVQNDNKCLEEKQYNVAPKKDLGLVDCVNNRTKLQQMITADELPSLLTGTMEAVVRPRMLNLYSGSGDFMGLGEVHFDFDCGEGVMSSISLFASGSHPLNGSCAQAALPSFNGAEVNFFINYTGADRIFLRSEGKAECLTALKNKKNKFPIIGMAECDDSTEQHWSFDDKHRLRSDSTAAYMQDKCAGVDEKTRLVLKDCSEAPSILWNEKGSLSLEGLPGRCVYVKETSVEVKECSGASTWSRGRGFATLSQAPLECPPGSVMKRVQKDTRGFNVTCAYVVGLGECLWGRTNQVTISESDTKTLQALTIPGMPRHALKSIKPEVSTGGRWVRIEYMYCALLLPSAVRPTGKFTTLGANVKEGVYCPTHRDGTGRPVFAQSTSFGGSGTDRSLRLAFNNSQGKWCINDDCARSHALHPLQKGRLEPENRTWVVRPVTDFDGNFEARGPGKGGAKAKRGPPPQPPKPPKLIKFEQVEPLYAEECKDDVFNDPKKMNEVGLRLKDENPCKLVAGDPDKNEGATYSEWDGLFQFKGKKGGFTWTQAKECVSRQVKRDKEKAYSTASIQSLKEGFNFGFEYRALGCGFLADTNIDPFGFGVTVSAPNMCKAVMQYSSLVSEKLFNGAQLATDLLYEETSAADCSVDGAFSRIFCDLHCVRDAVKQGDAAIMNNLKKSFDVMTQNNQMLFEHYTQTVLDKMDAIKPEKASLEQISEMKDSTHRMFVDMSQVAARSTFDVPSKASILRALNKLSAFSSQGSSGNATRHFMDLTEMTNNVQSLIHTAQEESFSGAAAVAHRVGEVAGQMLEASQRRNQILGVFTQSASISKQRQNWLWQRVTQKNHGDDALELDRMGTQNVLLVLDKTWWNIRTVVDRYLHAAGTQAKSYTDLVNVMDAYTSKCSASYLELSQSYSQAVRTEKHAHEVLLKAWDESVPLVGLLASQLCDGDAFSHFARSDIAAAKGETTRLIANKSKSLSVLGMMLKHDEICANSSAVHTAVQGALIKSFAGGLLGQTIAQLEVLFNELNLLEGGFADMNIGDPHDTEQIHDAQMRVQNCLASTTNSLSGHVQEVLREMRLHANC